ncbi:hypothetical protein SAMN05421812_11462 [Asanoa hainanensis]|uniref:Ribbon-helix-helix protein, copG family n=1 Tax=Asanoa hainanensis TaxID=560556 RepID=A0A239P5Z0_9ACTN|nr:hypothetical protein [Asanoa hainanensis]SNT62382.1 hypothetical protein SAMN05421812_11462 [Asanoa hainanensis]
MSSTTIEVDSALADRLAALARARGITMQTLLLAATDRLERDAFFARAQDQLERLRRAHPAAWEQDRAESRAWQQGTDRRNQIDDDEPGWWE